MSDSKVDQELVGVMCEHGNLLEYGSCAFCERNDLQRQLATSIADLTRYMDAFASQTESRERSRRDSYGY
jgi:hypothetical protein